MRLLALLTFLLLASPSSADTVVCKPGEFLTNQIDQANSKLIQKCEPVTINDVKLTIIRKEDRPTAEAGGATIDSSVSCEETQGEYIVGGACAWADPYANNDFQPPRLVGYMTDNRFRCTSDQSLQYPYELIVQAVCIKANFSVEFVLP